jgi:hypothetical protein
MVGDKHDKGPASILFEIFFISQLAISQRKINTLNVISRKTLYAPANKPTKILFLVNFQR